MEPKQEMKEWEGAASDASNNSCVLDLSIKRPTSPKFRDAKDDRDTPAEEERPVLGELSSCSETFDRPSKNIEEEIKDKFLPNVNNVKTHERQYSEPLSSDCDGGGVDNVGAAPLPELPLEDIKEGTHEDGTEYTDRDENLSSAISECPDMLSLRHAASPCPSPQVRVSTPPALPMEDSTSPCNLKVEPNSPSPQAMDHASHDSPIQDSTFPEVVPKTDPGSPMLPTDRTSSSTSTTDPSPGPSCTSSTDASPVPSRPYSSMLPILSIPKVRLRQYRSEGQSSWTHVPSDSPSLNVGGYFLDRSGGSTSGEQSGLDAMDYSSKTWSTSADSGADDLSRPSLLQMALQHGSTQVNMPATSQALEEQMELRRKGSSVGTCPTLPINPKNAGKAKPRTKSREKRYYQCEHCNIIYEQPRKLERHLQDLVGKPPYVCCYCDMAFPTLGCKRFHSRLHEDKTMPCPYCPKVFHERRRYDDHVRSHTGEAPFMCQECGNVYRTRSALRIHKRTHGNDKPLQCRFCPKRFIRIGDVQVHERTHTGEKPYKCGICESSFATSSQVNRHRRTHSEERPHQCSYCNKTFKNPDYLITHEKMHLGHKPHHCKYCPKQFRTPRELVHHERVHTGEKPFECQQCGHRFSKKTNLKQHELQHTGIKSFTCSKCPKSFYRKASLMWHEKIHENRERFLCKVCGKLFFKESSRDKHIRKAHGDAGGESGDGNGDVLEEEEGEEGEGQDTEGGESSREKTPDTYPRVASREKRTPNKIQNDGTDSTCEECGKTFLARRSLLRHYRAIHNRYISRNGEGDSPGTKPKKSFACRICSETFLTDHLRHVHEGTHTNASFTCETCNKTFSTRQLLVKHQKIHSDVKPHVCETCGSAFTIKWYLNRHINIVHSDVYSHSCSICDKKFKAKTALSVHMQLHNVEGKVYSCDQCDAEFHVKRYLARHKRKYHRGKDGAKSARRANTKHKDDEDDDDDDDDPMYDFDDNMDDGFDLMNDDSQAVSGVFLRQMLSKGSDIDDFNKPSKAINNHEQSDLEDNTNTLNNHESDSNNIPIKVGSDHDGSSPEKIPSNDQDMDQEHRLMQPSADIASTSKDISFEDGFDLNPGNDDAEPFDDRKDNHDDDDDDDDDYDGAFSLDGDEMSDYI